MDPQPMEFDEIVDEIVRRSGLTREEVLDRIWKTKQNIGIINLKAAAILVGREYGLSFRLSTPAPVQLKISDLLPGMSKVEVVGRIMRVLPPKEFEYSDGRRGQIGSVFLADETGMVRLVLWGEKANALLDGEIRRGRILRLRNGYVRQGMDGKPELSLGFGGSLELDPPDVDVENLPWVPESPVSLSELREGMEVDVVGKIISKTDVRMFEREDGSVGKVVSFFITDGKNVVRVSAWGLMVDEVEKRNPGDVVRIENALVKTGAFKTPELSIDERSRIIVNPPEGEKLASVSPPLLKIKDVIGPMAYVNIAGRVKRKQRPVEVKMQDGTLKKIQSVVIADETGTIRLTFWDDNVKISDSLKVGDVVLVRKAYSKVGPSGFPELHVGKETKVEINTVDVADIKPVRLKLAEVEPNMECLEVVGKVIEVSPVREFQRSDGTTGKVASIRIADDSGSLRVSLWGELAERVNDIRVNDVIRLIDVYSVPGFQNGVEIQTSETTVMEINPPGISVEAALPVEERKKISELQQPGEKVEVRGTIAQILTRRPYFNVCPRCSRTITSEEGNLCPICGVVEPKPRAVLGFLLDDGSGVIRVATFGELVERLVGSNLEEIVKSPDEAVQKVLGKEIVVRGTLKQDVFSGMLEIRAREIIPVEPTKEADALLQKIKMMREEFKVEEK
ncbi:MAG: OB-fold nucleic acid binding domain-containing protein [Candidatus Hadarchaeales archaeon]